MCSLLGVAISSTLVGKLSDRVGRKQPLLWMSIISFAGNIVKYYTRNEFWPFCITNFIFGFFLGNLPVGMAYLGDIFSKKVDKEKHLGMLVGMFVTGNAGGGMIAILMNGSGLFAPLWVGAGLCLVSAILIAQFLIEPGDERIAEDPASLKDDDDDEFNNMQRPEKIDQCAMWNVIGGALADNFGSTALFPMCLSPLALEQYTLNFINAGQEPIMSVTGYQWLSVCVALLVIPSTLITPHVFARIGPSGCCVSSDVYWHRVLERLSFINYLTSYLLYRIHFKNPQVFGNVFTGFLTMALLFIAGYAPATNIAYGFFVAVMYGGFPFTVFSQLTTGPMLDIIAPEDKLGFVQGLNNSAMNFGMALAPWLFGILADVTTTNISIWTGIGISFLAGAINAPLMWRPEMGPPPKKVPSELRPLPGEDEDMVERALAGSNIEPGVLFAINRNRAKEGKHYIVPKVISYEEEKDKLDQLLASARAHYEFKHRIHDAALAELSDPNSEVDRQEICDILNKAMKGDPDIMAERTTELGQWIGDYLQDNGYAPHVNSILIKQMILTAMPPISRGDYTPENMESALLRSRYVLGKYANHEEKRLTLFRGVLGKGQRPQFYT